MRQAVQFWRIVIFLLLLSALISTGVLLALTWQGLEPPAAEPAVPPTSPPPRTIKLLAPRTESLFRVGDPVPVGIRTTGQGAAGVEFLVNGQLTETRANPQPDSTLSQIELSWTGKIEGVHVLLARMKDEQGQWLVSGAVTVTVVPTGTLLFASNRLGTYAIYGMRTDAREPGLLVSGPGNARHPCKLPDGTLAYAAQAEDGRSVVYLALASGESAPIVAGVDPACPSRGTRLACVAAVDGTSQVLTVHPWGGAPLITTSEEVYAGQPAWSPDGSQIAYVADRDGNSDIWVLPSVGGEARRLTDDPAQEQTPAWSPDGTRLAFVSNRGGNRQVYTLQLDSGLVEQVTDLPGGAESPAWSPNGRWLAFAGYRGFGAGVNARELYLVRVSGGDPVRLTHNGYDDTDVTWVAQP